MPLSSQRIQPPGGLWAPAFSSAVPSWAPQSRMVNEEAACRSVQQGEGWLPPQPLRPPVAILGPGHLDFTQQRKGHRTAQGPLWLLKYSLDPQDGVQVPAFFPSPSGQLPLASPTCDPPRLPPPLSARAPGWPRSSITTRQSTFRCLELGLLGWGSVSRPRLLTPLSQSPCQVWGSVPHPPATRAAS